MTEDMQLGNTMASGNMDHLGVLDKVMNHMKTMYVHMMYRACNCRIRALPFYPCIELPREQSLELDQMETLADESHPTSAAFGRLLLDRVV